MATVKAVVRDSREDKNGHCKVEIAICHKSATCYLDSGIRVKKLSTYSYQHRVLITFINGMVTKKDPDYIQKNLRISEILLEYSEKLAELGDISRYSVRELASLLDGRTPSSGTVTSAMEAYCSLKSREGPKGEKNAAMCRRACERFLRWLRSDVKVEELNAVMLNSYKEYLKNLMVEKEERIPYWHSTGQKRYQKRKIKVQALSPSTISSDLSRLKAVLNHANKDSIDWRAVKISSPGRCDCDIEVEDVRKYRSLDLKDKVENIARDVWMLSFYLGGMNFADMMNVDFRDDAIFYTREKTRGRTDREVRVGIPIHAHARVIIEKYMQADGTLDFGYRFSNRDDELKMYAQEYRDARFEYGMPECFMFKSARHTFSQFASDLNLPERVTNYILAHAEGKSNIMYYYRKIKPKQVQSVMDIVFDYVDNPKKYENVLQYTQYIRDVI